MKVFPESLLLTLKIYLQPHQASMGELFREYTSALTHWVIISMGITPMGTIQISENFINPSMEL